VDAEAVGRVYVVQKGNRLINMKESVVISRAADCFIELIHRESNPTVWIVRRWKKDLWIKKFISSDWFIDEHQALSFAKRMKRDHDRNYGLYATREIPRPAE
jgi:hypothetical protein